MTKARLSFRIITAILLCVPGHAVFALEATGDATGGVASKVASAESRNELTAWLDEQFAKTAESDRKTAVDDGTFLRRVYLDLSGRIPSIPEVRDFRNDSDSNKRLRVIDQLLDSKRFGEHTARVWRRVLIPGGSNNAVLPQRNDPFSRWLTSAFNDNAPYDEVAYKLIVAGGAEKEAGKESEDAPSDSQPAGNPMMMASSVGPVAYLASSAGNPSRMASSVSRVFLGVKLECAQCHDHPFTDWKQQDFWGLAAFFSGARMARTPAVLGANANQEQSVVDQRSTTISDEDGNRYSVSLPWDNEEKVEVPGDELPRRYLADWLTSADNPHFAATAVNRLWQHLCGRGLTYSVDDLDQADEEEREMLDVLAKKFADGGFNVKQLVRSICASRFYQSPATKGVAEDDSESRKLKVLTPEQLFDSLEVALALPISSIDRGPRFNGQRQALVSRMEEAMGASPAEYRSGIPQTLTLMNGQLTAEATDLEKSRTLRAVVDAPFLNLTEKIEALFLATLSRSPHPGESKKIMDLIDGQPSEQEKADVFSQIMWGLINSPEFVLVR